MSTISLSEAINRLRRTGETLYGVIQGILSMMSNQPCLLDVYVTQKWGNNNNNNNNNIITTDTAVSTTTTTTTIIPNNDLSNYQMDISADLVLICCTAMDAEIIKNQKKLQLSSIGTIYFSLNEEDFSYDDENGNDDDDAEEEDTITHQLHKNGDKGRDSLSDSITSEDETQIETFSSINNLCKNNNYNNNNNCSNNSNIKECHIFWDVDTCTLPKRLSIENLTTIFQNLESILRFGDLKLAPQDNFIFITDSESQVYFYFFI